MALGETIKIKKVKKIETIMNSIEFPLLDRANLYVMVIRVPIITWRHLAKYFSLVISP